MYIVGVPGFTKCTSPNWVHWTGNVALLLLKIVNNLETGYNFIRD